MRRSALWIVTAVLIPLVAQAANIRVNIDGKMVAFSDVSETEWYTPYVKAAAEAGIVSGYKDAQGNLTGTFGPADNVTLAQSAKIAIEGTGFDVSGLAIDPRASWWFPYEYYAGMKKFDIQIGQHPEWPATRAEVAQMIADAFGLDMENDPANHYDDVLWDTPHAHAIAALTEGGVVSGNTVPNDFGPTTNFRPNDYVNRAEVVKMIVKARAVYGEPGKGSHIVMYSDTGFATPEIHVKVGDTVVFSRNSVGELRVASDPHPQHTDYPGFDSVDSIPDYGTYSFTFTKVGSWGYHNHFLPSQKGVIVVEP